ncbi:MAG: NAD(P)-dependent oxidoreductase [Candidatus Margulisiibacteriota bacterium]
MKIIVFGGSGFLGSHVADALTEKGHQVTVFDREVSKYLKEGQKSITGDITDEKVVLNAVKGHEIVYNYAGMADLGEAKAKPLETVKSNILGSTVILEACRANKVKRYVMASTLYVYSDSGSFYRASKQSCELLCECYKEIYGVDFTVLRYGSLYGPRSNDTNWIHRALKQALMENRIERRGDGEELREYIHVKDAAKMSVDVLSDEYKGQYVIISGRNQIKIKDLLVMVKEMLKNKVEIQYKPVESNEHYEITPFTFNPKLAKKIASENYIDLGQGILYMLKDLYKEYAPHKKHLGVYVKD